MSTHVEILDTQNSDNLPKTDTILNAKKDFRRGFILKMSRLQVPLGVFLCVYAVICYQSWFSAIINTYIELIERPHPPSLEAIKVSIGATAFVILLSLGVIGLERNLFGGPNFRRRTNIRKNELKGSLWWMISLLILAIGFSLVILYYQKYFLLIFKQYNLNFNIDETSGIKLILSVFGCIVGLAKISIGLEIRFWEHFFGGVYVLVGYGILAFNIENNYFLVCFFLLGGSELIVSGLFTNRRWKAFVNSIPKDTEQPTLIDMQGTGEGHK